MKLNVLRMVTDFLNDGTDGINALLASIPIDGGESAPAALASIVDATRANDAARLFADPVERTLPAGFVFDPDDGQLEGWTSNQNLQSSDVQLTVGIAFLVGNSQTADALRDAMIYRRAARKSLNRLNGNDHATERLRNKIRITRTVAFVEGPSWAELEGGTVVAAPLFVRYAVQDEEPL